MRGSSIDSLPTTANALLLNNSARFSNCKPIGESERVLIVNDIRSGKTVAVKVVGPSKNGKNDESLERVLSFDHPNIVKLWESLNLGEHVILVQEYLVGGDFYEVLQSMSAFTEALARVYAKDVISALSFLHSQGVAHRDVKPENCALDGNGNLKLLDFGLACRFSPGEIFTKGHCGTAEYAAPEIMREGPYVPPELDVWCLGVMIFEMVGGGLPFQVAVDGALEFHLSDELLRALELSTSLCELLQSLLQESGCLRPSMAAIGKHDWVIEQVVYPPGEEAFKELPEVIRNRLIHERQRMMTQELSFE